MPTPKAGESEQDFVQRCIPIVIRDGTAKDNKQAVAICYSMYKEKKSMNKSFAMKLMDMMGNMMEMDGESYAIQESWDIQTAANALSFVASMCQNEVDEPDDIQSLANIMKALLEFINGEIQEMVTAAKQGEAYEKHYAEMKKDPDGDFLVVDKDGQHLRVKENGKVNHRLMGAAWAALHGGYRGNKYEGSGKEEAISKLKRLYASEGMDTPSEKSLDLSYIKSLGIEISDNKLAVKYVGKNTIAHPVFLWGDEKRIDLELDYFTKQSNFWDDQLKDFTRPLTWEHGQDENFAMIEDNPVIGHTVKFYDDDIARWAESVIETDKKYRKYIDQFIEEKRLGYSSDSAPQYVQRVKTGKAMWIKSWPWFGGSLTASPCEPRMKVFTPEFLKSLGIAIPDTPQEWEADMAILDYIKVLNNL